MMKAAVYLRVSTLDQEKGIASQEQAVRAYLKGHNLEAVTFRDRLSGKNLERPGFKKLQKAIFLGQVDTVIVWKLDRLSRSLRDGVVVLSDWLEKGVRVIAISQQLDFGGAAGKLLAAVLFALGEMERDNLRENTKRGLAAARARGVVLGRPRVVDGKAIAALKQEGLGAAAIAEKLAISRQSVYMALRG